MQFQTWLRLNRSRRTEIALLLGFIVLIAVIALSGWLAANNLTQFITAAEKDRYYGAIVQELQSVIDDATVAENEQRGYLLTGDPAFLRLYDAALERVRKRLDGIINRTSGDAPLYRHMVALEQLSEKRVKQLQDTIALHRAGDTKRAYLLVRQGHTLSAAVQQRLDEVRTDYGTALTETTAHLATLRRNTIVSFVATAVLAAIILGFMGFIIVVESRFVRDLSNQLLRESRYDALTGLPNRAYLNDSLARAISGAQRAREKLGLLYMDLNGFKSINDTFGHNVGDQVLVHAARWFQSTCRGADFVARLGGDEFAVVMPRVDNRDQLAAASERFAKLSISRGPHTVTTSVGYALYPDDGASAEELTRLSDAAMYDRKQKSKAQSQEANR